MSEELKNAVIELREDDALRIADEELQGGTDPLEVVAACREAMDVIGQRFADEQLHHQERQPARRLDARVDDLHHVRAVDPRADVGLLLEALARAATGDDVGVHDLERDLALQARIASTSDTPSMLRPDPLPMPSASIARPNGPVPSISGTPASVLNR